MKDSDRDEIDVAMDVVENPETGELAVLEKGEWYRNNRDRYNPDEGGNPLEVPGGGIEVDEGYSRQVLRYEGLRELAEETDLADSNELEDLGKIDGDLEAYLDVYEDRHTDVEFVDQGEPFEVMQDTVRHTFYPLRFRTDRTDIEHEPEEHDSAEMLSSEEFRKRMTYNEKESARRVGVLTGPVSPPE